MSADTPMRRPPRIIPTLLLCLAAAAAAGQETATPPCSAPEFRQLDFWVGDWELSWTNADGTRGAGSNRITRDAFGDCVIQERFRGAGLTGMSVSTYHAPTGVWRQTWVDDSGGYFALTGGPSAEDGVRFELRNTRLSNDEPWLRMIWQDVTDAQMTWRWQMLPPTANPDLDSWQDRWVIRYRRVAGAE